MNKNKWKWKDRDKYKQILEIEAVRLSNRADVRILVRWGKSKNDGTSTTWIGIKQSGNKDATEKMRGWWYE